MKICKFWKTVELTFEHDGEEHKIKCAGGSDTSIEDAEADALKKIEMVKCKIRGEPFLREDYEVEIREEVLKRLDEANAVTRTRYGSEVLNSENLLFIDVDHPKFSLFSFLSGLFKKRLSKKESIFEMVRTLSKKPAYADLAFRLYETSKGARVIVLGRKFHAKSDEVAKLMRDFNCDPLYRCLCGKQNCFRARLTPKPSRLKETPAFRVKFPRSPEEDAAFAAWLPGYEDESKNYSTCRFVEQLGQPLRPNETVKFHDDATGSFRKAKLA